MTHLTILSVNFLLVPEDIYPNILQELVPVDVVTNRDCAKALSNRLKVRRSEICTVVNNAGACFVS